MRVAWHSGCNGKCSSAPSKIKTTITHFHIHAVTGSDLLPTSVTGGMPYSPVSLDGPVPMQPTLCRYRQLVAIQRPCSQGKRRNIQESDATFHLALALRSIGELEEAADLLTTVRDSLLHAPKRTEMLQSVEQEMIRTASARAKNVLGKQGCHQ